MASKSVFYSYSHKDELFREKLETSLALLKRQGHFSGWKDRDIDAGSEWKDEIDHALETSDIILLLVSGDFLDSDYCWSVEMKNAMARHDNGTARVVPIILRPCDWKTADFGKLQALPKDGKAVTLWENEDEAWLNIAEGLRRIV